MHESPLLVQRVHPGHGGYRVQLKVDGVGELLEAALTGVDSLPAAGDIVHVGLSHALPVYALQQGAA